jgi:prevent-host-death family protein
MSQTVFTAKEAKNNFGRLLDEARRSPVAIKKNGRKVVLMVPYEGHSHYEDIIDAYWGRLAMLAEREGSIGVVKSKKLMDSVLNA